MDRREAIQILKDERRVYIVDGRERKLDRALDMAIEALQESEQKTRDWMIQNCPKCGKFVLKDWIACPYCGASMRPKDGEEE